MEDEKEDTEEEELLWAELGIVKVLDIIASIFSKGQGGEDIIAFYSIG